METLRYLQLGASLYVPSTRSDLVEIGNHRKYPFLRSVIFCTEDAVRPDEVSLGLDNIAKLLQSLQPCSLLRFIRVRNPAILSAMLGMIGVEKLTGFVLPKITAQNVDDYLTCFSEENHQEIMLTLETAEVFDRDNMAQLRDRLLSYYARSRVLSLRIGGNDLLNVLALRRPRNRTIYATPVASAIRMLVTLFRPPGFNLTAPVFEYLNDQRNLRREAKKDLENGLFGKTAIHPRQIPIIENAYKVTGRELHMAEEILSDHAPAVFRMYNAMCEPATHWRWAKQIFERAKIYGIRSRQSQERAAPMALPVTPNGHLK